MILIEHLYLLLAYAGMMIHTLTKIEESRRKGQLTTVNDWFKKNIVSLITSTISIPVILIMLDSDGIKEFLPLNNVTSVLVGWQTQSIFKSIMSISKPKKQNDETTEAT